MNAYRLWLIPLVALVGCRAPMPSFKPFAPAGATRIDPPRTGSYGMPDPYYQPSGSGAAPSGNTQGRTGGDESELWADRGSLADGSDEPNVDDGLAWTSPAKSSASSPSGGSTPARGATILQASYTEDQQGGAEADRPRDRSRPNPFSVVRASDYEKEVEPSEEPANRSPGLRFQGMPVNDATSRSAPPASASRETEVNLIDISELPEPPPAVRARLRSTSAESATSSAASTAATSSTSGDGLTWKSR